MEKLCSTSNATVAIGIVVRIIVFLYGEFCPARLKEPKCRIGLLRQARYTPKHKQQQPAVRKQSVITHKGGNFFLGQRLTCCAGYLVVRAGFALLSPETQIR